MNLRAFDIFEIELFHNEIKACVIGVIVSSVINY